MIVRKCPLDIEKEKQLLQERKNLLKELRSLSKLIKGSLVKGTKKCGRKGCKCEKGELHPHVVISTFRKGKTHIIYVPRPSHKQATNSVNCYIRFKEVIERISNINIELLKGGKL